MQRHVEPRPLLQVVQGCGQLLHRLVVARVRDAEDREHPDRVFVDRSEHPLGREIRMLLGDRDVAGFDVPVRGELLPDHLDG